MDFPVSCHLFWNDEMLQPLERLWLWAFMNGFCFPEPMVCAVCCAASKACASISPCLAETNESKRGSIVPPRREGFHGALEVFPFLVG